MTNQEFNEDETMVDDNSYTISSSSKVGATIADDIQNSSIYSGVLALIAIFIYILIRFRKWQFSWLLFVTNHFLFFFSQNQTPFPNPG